jgi:hypothetical protein
MATRLVQGKIIKADNSPWVGGVVIFSLGAGSFGPGETRPADFVQIAVDALGLISASLWVTEGNYGDPCWNCRLPNGESFRFQVPIGTSVLQLEDLRNLGVSGDDRYDGVSASLQTLARRSEVEIISNQGDPGNKAPLELWISWLVNDVRARAFYGQNLVSQGFIVTSDGNAVIQNGLSEPETLVYGADYLLYGLDNLVYQYNRSYQAIEFAPEPTTNPIYHRSDYLTYGSDQLVAW